MSAMTPRKLAFFAVPGILLILACGSGSKTPAAPPTTATTAAVPPAIGTATTAAPPAGTGIGEGTWSVPDQVKPGTYRATVPADAHCYWARLKDLSGGFDAIIANGSGDPGSQTTVTIKATDKGFQSNGCGNWARVG